MTIATGQPMLASDVLNLAFFPKGTILMYDGTSWTDNVTLKGWYKCEGQTVAGYGTLPNLKNRFVIGYDAASTPERSKDNNSISSPINIAVTNLPGHSHSFKDENINLTGGTHNHSLKNEDISITGGTHGHTFKNENITSGGGAHTHSFTTSSKELKGNFAISSYYTSATGIFSKGSNTDVHNWNSSAGTFSTSSYDLDASHSHSGTTNSESTDGHTHTVNLNGKATNDNTSHSHTLNLNGKSTNDSTSHSHTLNLNGKSTNTTGSGTPIPLSFDNRPSYYALIYIVKVTNAGS
jgi:hypothetical protein